jgi:hypothetical protein
LEVPYGRLGIQLAITGADRHSHSYEDAMENTFQTSYHLSKVASILKISRPLVLKMAKSGELPCNRTPQGLTVLAEKLNQWVDEQRVNPLIDNLPQKK